MNCHRAFIFPLLGMLCASVSASEPPAEALSVVAEHKAVFSRPPEKIPSRMHPHDAPILGNGDLVAAMAGGPEYSQFWITTNDFWEFRKAPPQYRIRTDKSKEMMTRADFDKTVR